MKILIVRLSAMGDIVHALPLADNAARAGAAVGWVVERPYRELLESNPSVAEVFTADTGAWRRRPLAAPGAVRELRAALKRFAPDLTIDAQGLWKSAWAAVLAGAPVTGLPWRGRKEPASAILSGRSVQPAPEDVHVVDRNLALLGPAGIAIACRIPDARYLLTPSDPEADAFLARLPRPFALYHPGAGRPEKTWGEQRYADLARRFAAQRGLFPVVSWGPGDEERAAHLSRLVPEAVPLPRLGLRALAQVLAAARLVVAGDTGPLHLADALRTKVVAIFGPTDPVRNGPYGQPGHVVRG
ncbi:MAG: glycosyltransferase family 9 protein, partial [Thermoanaerobaculia bacterium]